MNLHFSLQRASLIRKNEPEITALKMRADARVMPVKQGNPSIAKGPYFYPVSALNLPQRENLILLGVYDNAPTFALAITDDETQYEAEAFGDIRQNAALLDATTLSIAIQAKALCYWHEKHPYCAQCGHATVMADAGYRRQCLHCAADHFPRCDPAIIVAVQFQEKLLLGRQASWPENRFSVVAGFVEPGESVEQAVAREVMEEAGLHIESVAYQHSQPWPYPASLMLAFSAVATHDRITLNDKELEKALFVSKDELAQNLASGNIRLPPKASIAFKLISNWFDSDGQRSLAELLN